VAKNNKTRFFYVLYCDKTWVFDQSESAQGPIYVIKINKVQVINYKNEKLTRKTARLTSSNVGYVSLSLKKIKLIT